MKGRFESSPPVQKAMNEDKIFLGNTPANTRAYLFDALKGSCYKRLVIPCCGQFAVAFVALQAGWKLEDISCSDVSLFSSILGCKLADIPIDSLEVRIDGVSQRGDAAELLYNLKLHTSQAQAKYYYQEVAVRDIRERKEAHIASIARSLERFDNLAGISYTARDMFEVVDEALEDRDTIVWVNPPGYTRGYSRMFDTGGRVTWAEPPYREFIPNKYHDELREQARGKPALFIWYRYDKLAEEDKPFAVFADWKGTGGKTRWDYTLSNRPEEFSKRIAPPKVSPKGHHLAVLPFDYEITGKSLVGFVDVSRESACYYRDLFIHKLGVTNARHNRMLVLDGYVAGVVGFSSIEKIKHDAFDAYSDETYGICAASHHSKLNRLLMMLIKSDEFLSRNLDTVQFRSRGIATTCLSPYPEIKLNRGILKLVNREELKDGTYKLRYQAERTRQNYGEVLEEWLTKYS